MGRVEVALADAFGGFCACFGQREVARFRQVREVLPLLVIGLDIVVEVKMKPHGRRTLDLI